MLLNKASSMVLAAVLLVGASLASSCAPGGADTTKSGGAVALTPSSAREAKRGGVLKVGPESDPSDWDIHRGAAASRGLPTFFAHESLVGLNLSTGEVVVRIAQSWNWANNTTLELTIREGAKYHNVAPVNGRVFTAEDAAWNLRRMMTKGFRSSVTFVNVDTIEATGPSKVTIRFKRPDVGFLEQLADATVSMGAKEVADRDGDLGNVEHTVGTGPFVLKEHRKDVGGSFARNPNYWVKDRPYLDGVEWFVMPDYATRLAALRTGQIDGGSFFAGDIDAQGKEDLLRSNPGMQFTAVPDRRPNFIHPNFKVKPLDDVRVRKALRIAIDQQEMIDIVLGGAGQITGPISPKVFPQWSIPLEELKKMPGYRTPKSIDIEEAKRLLAEAGYANGLTLESHGASAVAWAELRPLEVAKSQWAKIGVKLNINVVDRATTEDMERKGTFTLLSHGQGVPMEVGTQLSGRHTCKAPRNIQGYCNPKLDEIIEKQSGITDAKERRALLIEAQKILLEDSPHFWSFWPERFAPKQPWVKGLDFHSIARWGEPWNIWIDK
ncbi:MAG: ABC transporter substrate-binding protein [Chloroflexi bacterium]|nr:ABC transporter substrate-binding protein [Chloroflexota bacterium]